MIKSKAVFITCLWALAAGVLTTLGTAIVTTVQAPDFVMLQDSDASFDLTLSATELETLSGFTLIMDIVPRVGAVGTINFTAVAQPATSYVFDGNTAGFGGGINTSTEAGAFDTTNS